MGSPLGYSSGDGGWSFWVAVLLFEDRRKGEEYVGIVCENGRVYVSREVL